MEVEEPPLIRISPPPQKRNLSSQVQVTDPAISPMVSVTGSQTSPKISPPPPSYPKSINLNKLAHLKKLTDNSNSRVKRYYGYQSRPVKQDDRRHLEQLSVVGTAGQKEVSPLQELLHDRLSEGEFATLLEKASVEKRRAMTKEIALALKRTLTLVRFTSSMASELDLDRAMERITHQVKLILKADRATLFLIDHEKKQLWSRSPRDNIGEMRIPIGRGIASHVATTGTTVMVEDAYLDSTFFPEIDLMTGYKTTSLLCMPVNNAEGKPVAVLQALNKKSGHFTLEDQHILKTLCHQTSITLRNSQLYTAASLQQHKISVLLEVATQLSSELDTTTLIKVIMAKARELLDADRCTLFLLDRDTQELWSKVADGTHEIRFPMRMGIAGHVATTGETLNIPEAYDDSRFNKDIDIKTGYRTKSILCMPLRNNQGEIIGATQILNKKDSVFDKDDEELLNAFSAQAGVAIENAKLFQKTLEMSNYLKSILKSITNLVCTLDLSGKLLTCNREADLMQLTGLSESVMKGTTYLEWIGTGNQRLMDDITAVFKHPREIVNPDFDFTKKVDGVTSVVSMKYQVVPLMDFRQVQIGVVMIVEDITPQKRMMSTLSRYMSPALAAQVIKDGGDRLGGIHVTVAALFIDIRNFTGMSERMDAAEVVDMLNEYFEHMVNAIFEENGVLDKYIGDAVMAVFGVPFPDKDDSARACRCALQMLRNLKQFNARRETDGKQVINVGIGINTGRVLSGNIGSEKRLEYTVIGDGVNLASRIEGVTKQYGLKVLISEFTKQEVGNDFITREIDAIYVVGKKQPVRIFELMGAFEAEVDPRLLRIKDPFQRALSMYRKRDFEGALDIFRECHSIIPDRPSELFIERCQGLLLNPPPPEWDGVAVLDSK